MTALHVTDISGCVQIERAKPVQSASIGRRSQDAGQTCYDRGVDEHERMYSHSERNDDESRDV